MVMIAKKPRSAATRPKAGGGEVARKRKPRGSRPPRNQVCLYCSNPAGASGICFRTPCKVKKIRAEQLAPFKDGDPPKIEFALCKREADAVRKNPALVSVFQELARSAAERFYDALPKACPKTGKPHAWETNYDETFCKDCHIDFRERALGLKTYVNDVRLHYRAPPKNDFPWSSDPDNWKCGKCGGRLYVAEDGIWTDTLETWLAPPPGYINCRKSRF